jgi:hypothetical protein
MTCFGQASPDLAFRLDPTYISAMNTRPDKRQSVLNSEDRLDMGAARESYGSMPSWQRLAIWFVLGAILLGILGDLLL